MLLRSSILYTLTLLFTIPTYTQELRFEKVDQGVILNTDQTSLSDLYIHNRFAYSLHHHRSVHQMSEGISFHRIDIDGLLKDPDLYYSVLPFQGIYQTIFSMSYRRDMPLIEYEKQLQGRVVRIGDVLHLPDNSDHSYLFTFDGTYLGEEPGFAERERQETHLQIDNQPVEFPLTISGDEYGNVIMMESYAILLNNQQYAIVGFDDLNTNGENATFEIFPRRYVYDGRRERWVQHIQIRRLFADFFIVKNTNNQELKIFQANESAQVVEFPITQAPNGPAIEWSQFEDGHYFQIERGGFFNSLFILTEYKIHGLELQSAASSSWEMYR